MSDTPRTDAAMVVYDGRIATAPLDFTRQLERELASARELLWRVQVGYEYDADWCAAARPNSCPNCRLQMQIAKFIWNHDEC